jgi:hypothetical protein
METQPDLQLNGSQTTVNDDSQQLLSSMVHNNGVLKKLKKEKLLNFTNNVKIVMWDK